MIKLVATDIDGTIVRWGSDISKPVKNCVKMMTQKGVKVVLVTGRMHIATTHILNELGLTTPIISYQGGLIKDYDGNTLYRNDLASNYAHEIIDWSRKNNVHINLYVDDKLYVEHDNDIVKAYTNGKFIDYTVTNFDDLDIKDVNKILAIDWKNPDLVTSWTNELAEKYKDLTIVKSTPYFCEIGSGKAKKSLGVKFLADLWGIKHEEILGIGDQNNDIDLVMNAGIGVAMGNSSYELKQCAKYITDTVDNDGFARAMEKFVLNCEVENV